MSQFTFDETWQNILTRLKPGMTIHNWTVLRGYFGGDITIVKVTHNYIKVESPYAKSLQTVPRQDFEKIWKIWPGYKDKNFDRNEMNPLTRFSKYIIDILHWIE